MDCFPVLHLVCVCTALFVLQIAWEVYGLFIYLHDSLQSCSYSFKEKIIGLKTFGVFILALFVFIIWCAFDSAGRSWVKMKKFQESLTDEKSKFKYRRSRNNKRNWRHNKALREYEKSWDNRFRKICCFLNDRTEVSTFDGGGSCFIQLKCICGSILEFTRRHCKTVVRVLSRFGRGPIGCDCGFVTDSSATEGPSTRASAQH